MKITNINSNSNKNLQLVSTYGEKNQHVYTDLLEFKYEVNGKLYSVKDIFEKIFELEEKERVLKANIQKVLENVNKVQTLTASSLDLMDVRTQSMQQQINEIETKLKALI